MKKLDTSGDGKLDLDEFKVFIIKILENIAIAAEREGS